MAKPQFLQASDCHIQFADTVEAFVDAVKKSPKNAYILSYSEEAKRERDDKLKYLYIDESPVSIFMQSGDAKDNSQKFFFVQNPDGEIIACKKVQISPRQDEPNTLWFNSTNVFKGYRNKGFATALIRAALRYADENGFRVKCSSFETDGRSYLMHLYPRLHSEFPDLEIAYSYGSYTSAQNPYSIADGGRTIIPEEKWQLSPSDELTRG